MDIVLNIRVDDIEDLDTDVQDAIISEAIEHVSKMATDDYREGEISVQYNDEVYTGWWHKQKV